MANPLDEETRFSSFGVAQLLRINESQDMYRIYFIQIVPGLFEISMTRAWGRIGYNVKILETWFESMEEACSVANRVFHKKLKRGYVEVPDYRVIKKKYARKKRNNA